MNIFRLRICSIVLAVAAVIGLPLQSHAGYNMFLSLSGISGEAINNLIAVNSFSTGVAVPVSIGAGGISAGKATFTNVTIIKPLDLSSPVLALDCANGTHIATAVLTVVDQTSGNTLYTVTLGTVIISSVSTGDGTSNRPTETVTIAYSNIQWTYQQLDGSGNKVGSPVTHNWNLVTNAGS